MSISKNKLKNFVKKAIGTSLMAMTLVAGSGAAYAPTNVASAEAASVPTSVVQQLVYDYALQENPSLPPDQAGYIANAVVYYSYQYGVNPLLITSIIRNESTFNPEAVSPVGAIGLGQLMPGTASALGVDPWDVGQNIEGTCSYIATQLNNFSAQADPVSDSIAAYNAGPGAVWQYGGVPPYSETVNYVSKVENTYSDLYSALQYSLGM